MSLFDPLSKFKRIIRKDKVFKEIDKAVTKITKQIVKNNDAIDEIEERQSELKLTKTEIARRNSKYKDMRDKLKELM
jgi:peptidoglycan hydrolase CwlO-like protein